MKLACILIAPLHIRTVDGVTNGCMILFAQCKGLHSKSNAEDSIFYFETLDYGLLYDDNAFFNLNYKYYKYYYSMCIYALRAYTTLPYHSAPRVLNQALVIYLEDVLFF